MAAALGVVAVGCLGQDDGVGQDTPPVVSDEPTPSSANPDPVVPQSPSAVSAWDQVPATPVVCPAATVRVTTAVELEDALAAAQPGATIELADGTYVGKFVATVPGTASAPIHLCGSPAAILDGGDP